MLKELQNWQKKNKDLSKLALFPAHNPNPVIELDFNFNIVFANESAKKIFDLDTLFVDQPELIEKLKRLINLQFVTNLPENTTLKRVFFSKTKSLVSVFTLTTSSSLFECI